jgi:hypothetical protein
MPRKRKSGSPFPIAPKDERRAAAENSRCYDEKVNSIATQKKSRCCFSAGSRCRPNHLWFRGMAMLSISAALFRGSEYDLSFVAWS